MYFRYSSLVWSSLSSQASVRLMLSVGVIAVPRSAMNRYSATAFAESNADRSSAPGALGIPSLPPRIAYDRCSIDPSPSSTAS
jgi:hypothetical protein